MVMEEHLDLLLNLNLLKQNIAPIIITTDLLDYYHQYIQENDIEGMKNHFKIQSTKENEIIEILYEEYIKKLKYGLNKK